MRILYKKILYTHGIVLNKKAKVTTYIKEMKNSPAFNTVTVRKVAEISINYLWLEEGVLLDQPACDYFK